MPIRHILFALLIVAVWGFNFIFIEFGLREMSPLLLCTLRFFFASVPAVFFIKRPAVPFKMVILYGLLMFGLQFSLLFLGLNAGMTPGLAALLMQTQVFFSLFFAMVFLNEELSLWQLIGALISFTGIGLVGEHLNNSLTLSGFILVIASALSWGAANLVSKKMVNVRMMGLVVWGSLVACIPLLLLTLFLEGADSITNSIQGLSWLGGLSISYIVLAATWVGYGVWGWLLSNYPVATIAPFTLLVPIFATLSSTLILDEPLQPWKLIAGLLVISGLCINLLGTRWSMKKRLSIDIAESST